MKKIDSNTNERETQKKMNFSNLKKTKTKNKTE